MLLSPPNSDIVAKHTELCETTDSQPFLTYDAGKFQMIQPHTKLLQSLVASAVITKLHGTWKRILKTVQCYVSKVRGTVFTIEAMTCLLLELIIYS